MSGPIEVPSIHEDDFVAEVVIGDRIELRLAGSADSGSSGPFTDLLGRLHNLAQRREQREVVVDMLGLEFMSASAFNGVVGWLTQIAELPPERRYQLRFRPNPDIGWQQRSLRTLSCFATELVAIDGPSPEPVPS